MNVNAGFPVSISGELSSATGEVMLGPKRQGSATGGVASREMKVFVQLIARKMGGCEEHRESSSACKERLGNQLSIVDDIGLFHRIVRRHDLTKVHANAHEQSSDTANGVSKVKHNGSINLEFYQADVGYFHGTKRPALFPWYICGSH